MIYDTDAPVDEVATFYARAYGYPNVAPDATNNLSAAKPSAYYRTGDLATDTKAIEPLLPNRTCIPTSRAPRGPTRLRRSRANRIGRT